MINSQIILLLLGLYYINNNTTKYEYIKQSDDVFELLNNDVETPLKTLQPAYSIITVDNVKDILLESYKIRHATNSIKDIKLGEGKNSLDRNAFTDIFYGLEPYMDNKEKERYSKINSIASNVDRATKGIAKINGITGELSEKQNLKEKAGMLYEVLSPFIDTTQLTQAKNIAEMINMLNIKNTNKNSYTSTEEDSSENDDKQKHQIIEIIESIESKKNTE